MTRRRRSAGDIGGGGAMLSAPQTDPGSYGTDALRAALKEWRYAFEVFDSADDPKIAELALIRLEAAHRRFGCLAAGAEQTVSEQTTQ